MGAKILDIGDGRKMPAVGLGTWEAKDEKEIGTAVNTALEVGYRHIDTAYIYKNETIIGQVIEEWISSNRLKREDLFITTKLPMHAMHEDRVEKFLKLSLDNLQLDYVDMYLVHCPIGTKYIEDDTLSDVETAETDHIAIWKKMEEQVGAGRTRAVGLSNFNIGQIEKILKAARIKPACLQVELSVYLQQRDLVHFCHQNGIVVIAYSPLGSPGFNVYLERIGSAPKKLPDMLHDETIKKIATKHKKTNAQVMLRYLLQKNIAVIPKSVNPVRLESNLDVFDFSLDATDMKTLNGLQVGEEARVFDFKHPAFLGHPEFPFPK